MAVGAYFAVREACLRIHDDISIVGYDDQADLAVDLRPALTTVRLPYQEMGPLAAAQIFAGGVDRLPIRTLIPCPAVVLDSVAPPPLA
jgi:LacI family transcriptional regulator, galactose operon repressor